MSIPSLLLATTAVIALAPSPAQAQVTYEVKYRVHGLPYAYLEQARCIGDVNGDGAIDFLAGSPKAPRTGSVGSCAVISGADGIVLREHYGLTSIDWFAQDFTCLHDLNNDGIEEYAISAPGHFLSGDQGCVFIYDGATGAELRELRDIAVTTRMGDSVLGNTDFTGDGVPDLAVVAAKATVVKIYDGTSLLSALRPAVVFAIQGDSRAARPLNAMPDLNGDGVAEIGYVGDYKANIYDPITGAQIFTVNDWASSMIALDDQNGDGVREFAIGHGQAGGYDQAQGIIDVYDGATLTEIWSYYVGAANWEEEGVGGSMVLYEDVNGDGYRDIATGKGNAGNGGLGSGAELFNSKTGASLGQQGSPFNTDDWTDAFGADIEAGDIDGDGVLELIIGAPRTNHKYGGFIDRRTGTLLIVDLIF